MFLKFKFLGVFLLILVFTSGSIFYSKIRSKIKPAVMPRIKIVNNKMGRICKNNTRKGTTNKAAMSRECLEAEKRAKLLAVLFVISISR